MVKNPAHTHVRRFGGFRMQFYFRGPERNTKCLQHAL